MHYTALTEIGNALVDLLRREMVPATLQNQDHIGLCAPDERGDFEIGLYLYDIRPSEEVQAYEMSQVSMNVQKYPPLYVDVMYMVTAYSNGDIQYRAQEEQRLLGRVLQVFHDYPVLDESAVDLQPEDVDIGIELQRLSSEEKMRVWTVPNQAYKTSLFYKVGPVAIESTRSKRTARVTDVSVTMEEKREKRR